MPGKAAFVLFSAKLVWQHFEVFHWFVFNFIKNIQGVPGGKDLTSGGCSLGQTIPI